MNKRNLVISFVIVSNLIFVSMLNCQSLTDQELKTLFSSADTLHQDYAKPLRESENEINITISTVFLFYKTFISSQDMPTCIFTPSCSEYAVEAFQKKGLFIGWLSRCHGLVKPDHYPFDFEKKRFYDPVK